LPCALSNSSGDQAPIHRTLSTGSWRRSLNDGGSRSRGRRSGVDSGLGAVTELDLETHALRAIPSRVFDPLVSLTSFSMACNQTQATGQLAK